MKAICIHLCMHSRVWVESKGQMIKTGISSTFPPANPVNSHTQVHLIWGAIQFKIESDKRMYFPDQRLILQAPGREEMQNFKIHECSLNTYFVVSSSVT